MKIFKVHDGFPRIMLPAATEKRRMDEGRVDGSGGGKRSGRVGGQELAQSIRGFDEVYEVRAGHCEAGVDH
jgi:hypothetical protein